MNTGFKWTIVDARYLSDQVVFCVSHVHCVSCNGHTLRGVEGRFRQVTIMPPTFRPLNRSDDTINIMKTSFGLNLLPQ